MQDENAEPRKRKAECSEEDDPEAFCCPITLELMSHPVFLLEVSGRCYDGTRGSAPFRECTE